MSLEQLQTEWKEMFQEKLPQAAKSKSPAQSKWPVHVDHCFARIILDKKIGITVPWMQKIKSPAYKNMTEQQLTDCIQLGEEILMGKVDLVLLNEESLDIRGKLKGMKKGENHSGKMDKSVKKRRVDGEEDGEKMGKRRKTEPKISPFFASTGKEDEDPPSPPHESEKEKEETSDDEESSKASETQPNTHKPTPQATKEKNQQDPLLQKISTSTLTAFQKSVLSLLLQIPRGKYTTYNLISTHLSSSPRAVGNALRKNPFAPAVPCHRVLATGGGIGGFRGSWGRGKGKGENDDEKRELLKKEGVRFDGGGRVVGGPWGEFV